MPEVGALTVSVADVAGGTLRIALAGELDLLTAPALRQHLLTLRADVRSVELDVGSLDFVDSTGLGVFAGAHKRISTRGATGSAWCIPSRDCGASSRSRRSTV